MIKVQRWLIHHILCTNPKTRNSDEELYLAYLDAINPEYANLPVKVLLRKKDIPKMRSIERERRYWQKKDPATKAHLTVETARELLEEDYRKKYGKKIDIAQK